MQQVLKTMLENVRAKTPLVHNITNYVTVNDVANVLLAAGGSPIMSDDADDVEVVALSELEHVCRSELISYQDDGILNFFGFQKACGGAAAGEDALNALKHIGDVFNAVAQVFVVDLFKIATDLFESKGKRPFGIDKLFTDECGGFRNKRRILQDGPVDI